MQIVSADEKATMEKKREELFRMQIEVQERIRKAAALGDLSENAEYHFAKEENRRIALELAELESKLRHVAIAPTDNVPEDMVFLGHTVKLLDLDDDELRVVERREPDDADGESGIGRAGGSDELDGEPGYIAGEHGEFVMER